MATVNGRRCVFRRSRASVSKEILRLKAEAGLSDRKIAAAVGSSRSTAQEFLRRCRQAGLGWPLPGELDEAAMIARLYRRAAPARRALEIDFAQPQGVPYTAFCNQYRRWLAPLSQ